AKRRLVFELLELGLPVQGYSEREGGLAFDLLSSAGGPAPTGHEAGGGPVERGAAAGFDPLARPKADPVHREKTRSELDEPYRTVLGHMRHEIGHYYWPILAPDEPRMQRARALFGDEREDYAAALERHYATGPPPGWGERHVSAYATMHPAEDWAETFAHYLHIRDTLQTAAAHHVKVTAGGTSDPREYYDDFADIVADWLPLT